MVSPFRGHRQPHAFKLASSHGQVRLWYRDYSTTPWVPATGIPVFKVPGPAGFPRPALPEFGDALEAASLDMPLIYEYGWFTHDAKEWWDTCLGERTYGIDSLGDVRPYPPTADAFWRCRTLPVYDTGDTISDTRSSMQIGQCRVQPVPEGPVGANDIRFSNGQFVAYRQGDRFAVGKLHLLEQGSMLVSPCAASRNDQRRWVMRNRRHSARKLIDPCRLLHPGSFRCRDRRIPIAVLNTVLETLQNDDGEGSPNESAPEEETDTTGDEDSDTDATEDSD
jgi:hypothetical protein